jgi:hypothetical protein
VRHERINSYNGNIPNYTGDERKQTIIGSWNSFLWPLIITNSSEKRLLQPGLASLQLEMYTDIGIQMAGAAITSLLMLQFAKVFPAEHYSWSS